MISPTNFSVFTPLIGETAQGCWLGYGNALFLEFGKPQPQHDGETHPKGEFGLSRDHIEWRVEQGDRVIAGSEDERPTMEAGIRAINNRRLISGELSPSGDSVLAFSDGLILRTFVITAEEDARWSLRDRQGVYSFLDPEPLAAAAVRGDADVIHRGTDRLQQFYQFLLNSEICRVTANVQHRFEEGYEPSDLDFVQLDFRTVSRSERKHHPVGSLRIDVNTCGLRLHRAGEIVAACGDSSEKVVTQFKQLIGKKLLHINVCPPSGETDFVAEDELTLSCFPATSKSGDIWSMSSAKDAELVLGPGGRWSYKDRAALMALGLPCFRIRALFVPHSPRELCTIVLFPSKSLPLNHLAPLKISFPPIISAHGLVDDPSIPMQARIRQTPGSRGHDDNAGRCTCSTTCGCGWGPLERENSEGQSQR